MNKIIITAIAAALAAGTFAQEHGEATERGRTQARGKMQENPEAKLHRFSTTV